MEVVHSLLGIASDERLLKMFEALANHDPAAALCLLEESSGAGVQPGDLLTGLIDFVRDAMVLATGAESVLLAVSPRHRPQLKKIVESCSVDSILAALQILSECRARMRGSAHGRLLVELALVRVARLEDLAALGTLVERLTVLESGGPMPRGGRAESGGRRSEEASPIEQPVAAAAKRTDAGARKEPGIGSPAVELATEQGRLAEGTSAREQAAPRAGGAGPGTALVPESPLTARIPTPTAVLPTPEEPPDHELDRAGRLCTGRATMSRRWISRWYAKSGRISSRRSATSSDGA